MPKPCEYEKKETAQSLFSWISYQLLTSKKKRRSPPKNYLSEQIYIHGEKCDVWCSKNSFSKKWFVGIKSRYRFVMVGETYPDEDTSKSVYRELLEIAKISADAYSKQVQ